MLPDSDTSNSNQSVSFRDKFPETVVPLQMPVLAVDSVSLDSFSEVKQAFAQFESENRQASEIA